MTLPQPRPGLSTAVALLGAGLLSVLVALVDYVTGVEIDVGVLYLAPVIIGSWWGQNPAALASTGLRRR